MIASQAKYFTFLIFFVRNKFSAPVIISDLHVHCDFRLFSAGSINERNKVNGLHKQLQKTAGFAKGFRPVKLSLDVTILRLHKLVQSTI